MNRLFELLPAVHRLRDAAIAGTIPAREGPLESLLSALAEEVAALDEAIEQLYDDQFIETCAPWVAPYIGDLIGYRSLHGLAPGAGSRRAEVAHTIALRRRKGTASVLEQLARDVTGWEARVVEFFSLLATTQYMNHRRPGNLATPSMRDAAALDAVGTAFDAIPRTLDVRRIASGRGRHNIPNIGVFLWRVGAYRLARSPATPSAAGPAGRSFRFSPLGADAPLLTRPQAEEEITHLAEPINVPAPIRRGTLARDLNRYYGAGLSLEVHLDGAQQPEPSARIAVCDLRDDGAGWAHDAPPDRIAVDPELGRLVIGSDITAPASIEVTYHYGAAGDLGGGTYPREATFESPPGGHVRVPADHATIQAALDVLGGSGVVEIEDNGRYRETLTVDVAADRAIELRSAPGRRATVELTGPLNVRGGAGSSFVLNGLLVAGDALVVPAASDLRRLRVVHTTLVPGRTLLPDGEPAGPTDPSLLVRPGGTQLDLLRSITGPIRVREGSSATLTDCILDAGGPTRRAYNSTAGQTLPGGALALEACTVIGRVGCESLSASNSILTGTTDVVRRQEGCLRFSFAPLASATPRHYRCQPTAGKAGRTSRASRRSGTARRPTASSPTARPRRSLAVPTTSPRWAPSTSCSPRSVRSDLRARLDEYLRVGLEVGIFHES